MGTQQHPDSKNRVVSQVERVESSPTKPSFMNLKAELGEGPTAAQTAITSPSLTPNVVTLPNKQMDSEVSEMIIDDNKLDVGDSYLGFLRNKKSSIETSINSNTHTPNTTMSDPKLKKATNPSIASLRGISELSTPTGTVSKGSSRAEFFAAKLHHAINDDSKKRDDTNEAFVYDTSNTGPKPTEPELDFGAGPVNGSVNMKLVKDDKSTIADTHSVVTPSEYNTVGHGSPYFNKYTIDDTFDLISKSSMNSRPFQRKLSKESAIDDTLQPSYKDDASTVNGQNNQNNQLRQITSRLFDSKGVQPRRYSGIENDVSLGDSFDDDFDYYESNMLNPQTQAPAHTHPLHQETNGNIYSIDENDSDFEDQLSHYFRMNSPRTQDVMRHSSNGNTNAYHQFNDYGSVTNEAKLKQKKKRTADNYLSPHDFTSVRLKRIRQVRSFFYTAIGIISLLFTGFILGFILATNKELQQLEVVDVTDVLVSQEAFIFDMVFDAFNPGLMPINIRDVQLDIFAKTMYVDDGGDEFLNNADKKKDKGNKSKKYDTVLLGSIEHLELPLSFNGGFLTRQHDISITEMKILNPCARDDDDDDDDDRKESMGVLEPSSKWLNISRNPFELIVRGAMVYHLPLSPSNHTVSVSYTTHIEPGELDV